MGKKRNRIRELKLKAPQSFWEASEEDVDKVTGGCGPGGVGDYLVPDTVWGLSIFLACRVHDWMYGECHKIAGLSEGIIYKRLADDWFLENMYGIIEVAGCRLLRRLRRRRAKTYYWNVVQFGDSSAGVSHGEKAVRRSVNTGVRQGGRSYA